MKLSPVAMEQVISSLSRLRITVPKTPWKFADENFYLPPESSGISGRWTSYPYQRGFISLFAGTSVYKVVVFKPKRIGYTKCLVAATVCLGVDRKQKIGIWHPVESDSRRFYKTEIIPLFDYVKVFRDALKGSHDKRNPDRTIDQINLNGSLIYFNGAKSSSNFRQITVDCVIGDEVDAFEAEVGGEGDVIELMEGRNEQSPWKKCILGSTCTVEGASIIEKEFNATDIKLMRFIPCPHCEELQHLQWENFKYEKSKDGNSAVSAWFECVACMGKIEYHHYSKADEDGVWMTDDKKIWYDDCTDSFFKCGEGYLRRVHSVGLYIWSAYSYAKTWIDLATGWIKANNAAALGDRGKLVTFINQCLARTTKESGARFSPSVFDGKIEDFDYQSLPDEIDTLTAGLDIQTGINQRVEIVVIGTSKTKKDIWIVRHEVVDGDISTGKTVDDVNGVLFDIYKRRDGKRIPIVFALMDEGDGNKTNAVRAWSQAHLKGERAEGIMKRAFRTCKGVGKGPSVHYMKWYGETPNPRAKCHHVNQVAIKDILFRKAIIKKDVEGGFHLFRNVSDEFIKQFFGERRVVHRDNGVTRVKYEPITSGQRVEALDCTVYAYAASILANASRSE